MCLRLHVKALLFGPNEMIFFGINRGEPAVAKRNDLIQRQIATAAVIGS
jgi:hypothetical protein